MDRPTITIKLKPYLQEFLRGKLQDDLTASSKNIIGVILRPFLEVRPPDQKPEFHKGPGYITFEIPRIEDFNVSSNIFISIKNQRNFERILESHFRDLFFQYMEDKMRYVGSYKKCILQFCADYGIIFNEITFEMLKKAYYRRQKRQNSGKSLSGIVPVLSLIFLLS